MWTSAPSSPSAVTQLTQSQYKSVDQSWEVTEPPSSEKSSSSVTKRWINKAKHGFNCFWIRVWVVPFNFERTLLAVFLMSAVRSSNSCLVSAKRRKEVGKAFGPETQCFRFISKDRCFKSPSETLSSPQTGKSFNSTSNFCFFLWKTKFQLRKLC